MPPSFSAPPSFRALGLYNCSFGGPTIGPTRSIARSPGTTIGRSSPAFRYLYTEDRRAVSCQNVSKP